MASRRRRSTITPCDPSNPQFILSQMQSLGSELAQHRHGAREQLLDLSHALISALELPCEAIQRFGWAEPARTAYLRTAVDLDLFAHLHAAGSSGITSDSLASKCGADLALLSRILKHLAAMHIILETELDTYAPTPLSNTFTKPGYRDGMVYSYDVAGPSFQHLPTYLRATGFRLPTSPTSGPFQAAHGTDLPFAEWLDGNPEAAAASESYMAVYRASKPSWADDGFYPIADRLVRGFDPGHSEVFLVDVGGGSGDDLRELYSKTATALPGKLVLQDREEVVAKVKKTKEFEAQAVRDLFAPQTVKGARAYFLRSVLRDWGDEDCVRILEGLRPALAKGYSRLLINEIVVPSRGASWPVTAMDSLDLVLGGVRERTEADWNGILARAGFHVVKVYTCELGRESLIEAELV